MSSILDQLQQLILAVDSSIELASISSITVAIHTMDEIFESVDPKKFALNIDQILSILQLMINDVVNVAICEKTMMLDFILLVIQGFPKIVKNHKYRISRIYKMTFELIMQAATEIDNQWMDPPNGFAEDDGDDEEQNYSKAVMTNVDQLSSTIGFSDALIHIQPIFLEFIQNVSNWRYPYAALMAASQIAVQNADPEQLGLIVQWGFKETDHSHPKVRYAALQLIGQYGDDLKPEFQDLYYDSFVEVTTKTLQDPVPRVVAHTFASATNFFDQCKDVWKIENCLGHYLTPIVHYLKTGNSWLKENALSILASFGETQGAFGPNLPNIFELGFQIVNTFKGQQEYKQVINQAFQLLSMLLTYQKKTLVQPYLNQIVNLLFTQKANFSQEYLLQAWHRICTEYEDFTDIGAVYHYLLEAVEKMTYNYSDDECGEGVDALSSTFESFKTKLAPFAEQTISKARSFYENKDLSLKFRQSSLLLMAKAFKHTQPNSPDLIGPWKTSAELLFDYICYNIEQHIQEKDLIQQLPFLFEGLELLTSVLAPFLTGDKYIACTQKQIFFAGEIQKQYDYYAKLKNNILSKEVKSNQFQDNQLEVQATTDKIDNFQQAIDLIPDVIKELVKACSNHAVKMQIIQIMKNQIQKCVGKDSFTTLYALNLSVSIIETLSYEELSPICGHLFEVYFHFSTHPNSRIRNGGIYGINLILNKTPKGIFGAKEISTLLQTLSQAYTQPFQDENEKFYHNHCKDNIISALGMLLKYYSSDFPEMLNSSVFGYWFENLPLNTDKSEGNNQQQYLIELLMHNPGVVIKEAKDLKQVCQIFAKFIMKRVDKQYSDIVQKTKNCLKHIQEWTLFKQSTDYLWNSLSNSHRSALTQLINS